MHLRIAEYCENKSFIRATKMLIILVYTLISDSKLVTGVKYSSKNKHN